MKKAILLIPIGFAVVIVVFLALSGRLPLDYDFASDRKPSPSLGAVFSCERAQVDVFGRLPDPERESLVISLLDGANRDIYKERQNYQKQRSAENITELQKLSASRKPLLIEAIQRSPKTAQQFLLTPKEYELFGDITRNCVESRDQVEGVLQVMHIDLVDESARDQYTLVTSKGEHINLYFSGGIPQELVSSTKVKIDGLRLDDNFFVDAEKEGSIKILSDNQGSGFFNAVYAAVADAFGVQRTLVLLVNFQNTVQPSLTKEYIADMVFNKVDSYFYEVSYGKVSFSGDVFGWYTIPISQTCSTNTVLTESMKVANANVDFTKYDRMLIIAPMGPSCSFGGQGTVGKYNGYPTPDGSANMSVAWVIADRLFAGRVGHEFGHGFGLRHANFLDCKSGIVGSSGCVSQEYGDLYSTMGASNVNGHLNALHKDYLGWFGESNIKTITANGTYILEPLETLTSGLKALKIQRASNDNLFVEYRRPIGFDANFFAYRPTSNVYAGGLLHTQNTQVTGSGSLLIDPTPPSSSSTVALSVNESFVDPLTKAKIQVLSQNSNELALDIELTQGDIIPPTVSFLSPTNYTSVSGTIKVTASASDDSGIKKVDFYKSVLGNYIFLASDTTAPYEFNLDTTALPNGTNYLKVTAYDLLNNQKEAIIAVSVGNLTDTTLPSIQMTAPLSGALIDSPVFVSVSSSDNIGVWKVEFYKDSDQQPFYIDTSSPYGYTLALPAGVHTLRAKAYDSAGNNATAPQVAFTVKETADTILPRVAISGPVNGAVLGGIADISVSASDNIGVARVEFYSDNGTVPFSTDLNSPFGTAWDTKTFQDGRHTLRAKAYDVAGNSAISTEIAVTIDNVFPIVNLSAPQDNSTASGSIVISVSASDNIGIGKINFYRDDNILLGTDTSAPFSINWDTIKTTNGRHTIFARAIDKADNASSSPARVVNIDNGSPDIAPPAVSITSPLSGAAVAGYVMIEALATDDKKISKVEFYVNNQLKCSDALISYSCRWSVPLTRGVSYQLHAKAYDASGNSALSGIVTVNADNILPEVSVSGPTNGATVSGKTVNISAIASDNISVKQIVFYLADRAVKTITVSPYQFNWDSTQVVNGTHVFYARAYDQIGNEKQSLPVAIRVMNSPIISILSLKAQSFVRGAINITTQTGGKAVAANVGFYKDNDVAPFVTDTISPFSATLNTIGMTNGDHIIRAKASDGLGNTGISEPVTIMVDNLPPSVSIAVPMNNSSVSGKTVAISADASDNTGVGQVKFYLDGRILKTAYQSPYQVLWDSTLTTNGSHTLQAEAIDKAGNAVRSESIIARVNNNPVIAISVPKNNAVVGKKIDITFVNKSKVVVNKAEVYVDDSQTPAVVSAVSSLKKISWDTASTTNGAHSIRLKAYDEFGNFGFSEPVGVMVDNILPTVGITSPSEGAMVSGAYVNFSAAASDNIGIRQVRFYINGRYAKVLYSAPYNFSWNSTRFINGIYSIYALAYDFAGNAQKSQSISVSVNNSLNINSPFDVLGLVLRGLPL